MNVTIFIIARRQRISPNRFCGWQYNFLNVIRGVPDDMGGFVQIKQICTALP